MRSKSFALSAVPCLATVRTIVGLCPNPTPSALSASPAHAARAPHRQIPSETSSRRRSDRSNGVASSLDVQLATIAAPVSLTRARNARVRFNTSLRHRDCHESTRVSSLSRSPAPRGSRDQTRDRFLRAVSRSFDARLVRPRVAECRARPVESRIGRGVEGVSGEWVTA